MWTGPYAGFFHLGLYAEKVPNIQRIINNHLKIVNIVFSGGGWQFPPSPCYVRPCAWRPLMRYILWCKIGDGTSTSVRHCVA